MRNQYSAPKRPSFFKRSNRLLSTTAAVVVAGAFPVAGHAATVSNTARVTAPAGAIDAVTGNNEAIDTNTLFAVIVASPDTPATVSKVLGNASLINALANDTLNGTAVNIADVDLTVTSPASNPGVSLNTATGVVSVAPGTPVGTYSIGYQICEKINPTNCKSSTVTVVVAATPIAASNDSGASVNGKTGNPSVYNALANDTLNGAAVNVADVNVTITTPAAHAGVTLDTATGNVAVAPGTPAGTYTITYQICEKADPANCKSATASVTVTAAPIATTVDNPASVGGAAGNPSLVNALANDTLNGAAVNIADVVVSVVTPASNPGVSLNTSTGIVSVAPGTPAGTYAITYRICEALNPTNCSNNTVNVVVTAAVIVASPDTPATVSKVLGNASLINALANDTLNGTAVNIADVDLTVTSPASNPGVSLNTATGVVSVAPGTPVGTYTIGYQICEKINPANCKSSTVTVVVAATPIAASNDSGASVNGKTGNPSVYNALANDTLNGVAVNVADVNVTITTPAAHAGVTLDTATGNVAVAPGTPAGTYTITYQICEKADPANCKSATASVTVTAAPIVTSNDGPPSVIGATGNATLVNALTNDTLNGVAVNIADVNLTIVTPSSNPGVSLDTATGNVSVAAGTPAGSFPIQYRICEKLNPANCSTSWVNVVVTAAGIVAAPDNPAPVRKVAGSANIINALANDTLNSQPVNIADVNLTVTSPASNPGVALNTATGTVSVAPGTPAGTYTIGYQICEKINPANCKTSTVTIVVESTPIAASDDSGAPVNGFAGNPLLVNALANDTLDGTPVNVADVNVTITTPASHPGVALDPATGAVSIAPGTPAGAYSITYQICEKADPLNCKPATVSVTVTAAPIAASVDTAGPVTTLAGGSGIVNAFANDTLNGAAVDPAKITGTVVTPASNTGVTLNTSTGLVSVAPGTPAGTYAIDYRICENLNSSNCSNSTINVTVAVTPVTASADTPASVPGAAGNANVVNAFANDTLGGVALDLSKITATVETPASNAGVTLNTATGIVSVAPGTPAGTYTIGYKICETANPSNCATATVTIIVAAAVIATTNDSPASVNGKVGQANLVNVLTNDDLNGTPVALADVNLTVESPASNPGVTLNTATGNVSVAAGTPAGSYTIGYKICEKLNPTNCSTATVAVVVTAAPIAAGADSPASVNGASGNPSVVNAFANDTLNGAPLVIADVNVTIETPASNPGVALDPATGIVSVAPGTPAGTYTITYKICEKLNPTNCATSSVTVVVDAAPIAASADSVPAVNGKAGGNDVIDVFANDTLNGVAVTLSSISASVTSAATAINGGPVPVLDPATGLVDVPAGTPAGTYTIGYEICETLNPANCASSSVTIVVTAAPIAAGADSPASVNGASGNPSVVNAFANDTLNGAPLVIADVNVTIESPASNPGVALDPATGIVSVAPGTPAGTYTIAYKICEKLNPTNCATSSVTVVVDAAPIAASADSVPAVNGKAGGNDVIDVFANDTLNGVAVTLSSISASVTSAATAINGGPVPVLDPATGLVDVPAGTPAGSYTIAYEICETLNPANCASSSVTIVVTAAPIAAGADSPASVNGASGNPSVVNAFANDTLNGAPLVIADVNVTIETPASNPGVALDPATGIVSVAPGTPAGTYTITYKICEKLNPTNCATSSVTVVVDAAPIAASADSANPVNGANGVPLLVNVLTNDMLNGVAATPANTVMTVTSPAANPGVVLDPATGNVSVAAGTPAGTYSIGYQICEVLNPGNCATATVVVVVDAGPISAVADTPAAVNGALGNPNLGNAFANDLFNGQPVVLDAIVATITTPAVPATLGAAVPAIDPATGLISVPPGTPAGTYTITYQICEKLNPANCASASVTLTVEASTIAATADAPAMVRQGIGSTNLVNAFANDQLGGQAIDPAKIIATVTAPASNPGVVLDPATGIVSVAADVPEGEYVIGYQICEKLNPTNCSTSSVTVIVGHPLSTVSGMVFTDNDGDKVFDPGETPRAGWIVEVVLNGVVVATTTTDADGKYSVANLPSGPGYEIRFINPENHVVYDVIKSLTLTPNTNVVDQNQPIDPSGVIYDSVTRAPVRGAQVMLTNASGVPLPTICFVDASQAGQTTGASGEYRFDIVPGAAAQCPLGETIYKVSVVPPAGYASGSTVLLPQTGPFDPTGMAAPVAISSSVTAPTEANPIYYLDFRLANGDPDIINNHIALDPFLTRAPLTVTKTSIRRSANVGDLVPYEITVRNNENVQRAGINVVDILPAGMNYVTGTGLVNGMAVEPVRTERQVAWTGQVVPANATVRYNLTLVVGAGVTGGERVNTGIAQNGIDGTTISNRGTAVVSIVPSAVFDCSEVLGKVFEDANRNGYQDEGEPGVPGVRLVTVNGQMITTDGQGRYHVACAAVPDARIGSNFVLKVDPATLPLGWEPTSENPRSIRLTRGRFGEMNFGVAPAASPTSGAGGPTPTRTEGGE